MAGDWIKMRGALLDHPKVIAIGRALHVNKDFREWLTPGGGSSLNGQLIGDAALRCVTTALLMRVWSIARESGTFVGEHLVLTHSRIRDLDQMAGAPGLGEAMQAVKWAIQKHGVTLPNFKEFNVPMTSAEKQREYRNRQHSGNGHVTHSLLNEGNVNRENVTSRVEKRRSTTPIPPLFARFWAAYPKKKNRGTAEKAFAKIHPDEQLLQAILSAAERAKTSDDWRKENGRYIPHPASWLNARGWEDEPAAATAGSFPL